MKKKSVVSLFCPSNSGWSSPYKLSEKLIGQLKDVRAQKTSHAQIFLKLWLSVENDKIR